NGYYLADSACMVFNCHTTLSGADKGGFMSRRIQILGFVALGAMPFLLLENYAMAQSRQSGEIRGTVSDQTSAVMPDVEVTITNVLTGISFTTKTNAAGVYEAP